MFEKEAEEYLTRIVCQGCRNICEGDCAYAKPIRRACLEMAEFGYNKAKEEDKALIEKMKCCEMCKYKNLNWEFSPICEARDKIKIENPLTCKCDKWEIKEND